MWSNNARLQRAEASNEPCSQHTYIPVRYILYIVMCHIRCGIRKQICVKMHDKDFSVLFVIMGD